MYWWWLLLGLLRRSTNKGERRRSAFRSLGQSLIRNDDIFQMKMSVHMNLVSLEREARRGKKVKEQINIFKAAKKLFEV